MATEVWISLDDDPDRSGLGAQWLLAGRLDESRETDVWQVVQGYLGYRAWSRARSVDFYADVEPDSDGHRALLEARPPDVERLAGSGISFWVAHSAGRDRPRRRSSRCSGPTLRNWHAHPSHILGC